jgi:cyclohexa-1,5-dienecarbonyl-CoA hydratase
MDTGMMRELGDALENLNDAQFLIFAGDGSRGFSAGAEVADHTPDRVADMLGAFHRVFRLLWRGNWISIAVVHGVCLGGGCELATFCDFVLAEESAQFGQPEIKLGCFPPVALVTLPRLAGPRAAADLILTGRTIAASEARSLGLVTRVVKDGEAAAAAKSLLAELRALSPIVLRLTRRALLHDYNFDFEGALDSTEQFYLGHLMQTTDAAEGIRAFLEKRAPVWKDC